jgi:hypothetical protein
MKHLVMMCPASSTELEAFKHTVLVKMTKHICPESGIARDVDWDHFKLGEFVGRFPLVAVLCLVRNRLELDSFTRQDLVFDIPHTI